MLKTLIFAVALAAAVAAATEVETSPEAAAEFEKGVTAVNAGKLDDAIAHFEKSLDYDPKLTVAYEWIAYIKMQQSDTEGAIAEYEKIVQATPTAEARTTLGLAYINVGRYDDAITVLKKATSADPSLGTAWNNLALAYLRKGMLDEAESAAEKAVALDPDNGQARSNLGSVYIRRGLYDEAWDEFETARERTPDDPNPYYGIAEVARYRGEEKLAGDNYLKYLELGGQEQSKRQRAIDWLWDHGRGAEIPK
ncbi:MAG: tetratricopeptide repeat protein [Candidatus Coatesbacteria bacterium]|nr:MAG: tetratricopeptide repeat protein [Candidatus Coatesbacteria bacterium]